MVVDKIKVTENLSIDLYEGDFVINGTLNDSFFVLYYDELPRLIQALQQVQKMKESGE